MGGILLGTSDSGETTSEVVDPETSTEHAPGTASTPLAAAAVTDDYDYWCENGSICTRETSKYISETKGNAAYGNGSGAIGSFDVVVRTNLNGRQPQWRTWWKKDSGPALSFSLAELRCKQNIQFWPDGDCGSWRIPNNGAFRLSSSSAYYPGWLYGDRLSDDGGYYSLTDAYFTPDGYGQFTMAALRTQQFDCPSLRGNCTFP